MPPGVRLRNGGEGGLGPGDLQSPALGIPAVNPAAVWEYGPGVVCPAYLFPKKLKSGLWISPIFEY